MTPQSSSPFRGRCVAVESGRISLLTPLGIQTADLPPTAGENVPRIGDWVEVTPSDCKILTRCHSPSPDLKWPARILDPRRQRGLRIRAQVEATIREFFRAQDFLETRTPLLVPCPGMETHIRPLGVSPWIGNSAKSPLAFLPTSPEFAMKRLLVGGLERIFQITPAFRHEPFSTTHHPEFTMLEWYRAYAKYDQIMGDTEQMIEFIARKLFGRPVIPFQGREIQVAAPWPRLRVRDLFQSIVDIDLTAASRREDLAHHCARLGLSVAADENWDDLYFKIWLNKIEPLLPSDQAVFVYRYPPSQAALAVVDHDDDGTRWARRFEIYAAGLELGNAFEELTDPVEQRHRFIEDMETRKELYGSEFPATPIDEGFLAALEEGMPPSSGIAVGVDRLVMLFADEPEIDYTVWIRPELSAL